MELKFYCMLAFLSVALVASHAALPLEVFWDSVLPNSSMLDAVKDLIHPEDKSTNVGVGKGDVSVGVNPDPNPFFFYQHAATDAQPKDKNTNGGVGKGGVSVGVNPDPNPFFFYQHAATDAQPQDESTNVGVGKGGVSVGVNPDPNPFFFYQHAAGGVSDGVNPDPNPFFFYQHAATDAQPRDKSSNAGVGKGGVSVGANPDPNPFFFYQHAATDAQSQDKSTNAGVGKGDVSVGVNPDPNPFFFYQHAAGGVSDGVNPDPNPFFFYQHAATDAQPREKNTNAGVGKGGVSVGVNPDPNPFFFYQHAANDAQPQDKSTNAGVGKGGVSVGINPDPNPFFFYRHAATGTQLHDNPNVALFFLQKDLNAGKRMNLNFLEHTNKAAFLPRTVADSIPFSSDKLPEIYSKFSVDPSSEGAKTIKQTIKECEEAVIKGEEKFCATSLESMIDFSTSKIGKNVEAISTNAENQSTMKTYSIVGVKKMNSEKAVVVCHRREYAYAVFYCHKTETTVAYKVSMVAADGLKAEAAAVCHQDTAAWNPKHVAFQVLKVMPGAVPVCHFLTKDTIVWVAKN